MVIYPQGIWYGHVTEKDLDAIIEKTLLQDEIIDHLHIREDT
jgi:(2Fe-2S) ferredoxin